MSSIHIKRPQKTLLTMAIALALSNGIAQAQEPNTSEDADDKAEGGVETIIITSTRRSENQQVVPIAVQAISGETLQQLGVDSFDDYIALLPGVSSDGQGPGKQETYIRGVSAGRAAVRISGIGGEPSVAFYLDEAPITTPGRNIDLYAVDLQRVEVLKGPQGTLFGASSQAGTVRLISNKPDLLNFEQAKLLKRDASGISEASFPDSWQQDSLIFKLSYALCVRFIT